jgi:hypothetical protein
MTLWFQLTLTSVHLKCHWRTPSEGGVLSQANRDSSLCAGEG